MRAVEVLVPARSAQAGPERVLMEIAVRTIFECVVRGRYLLRSGRAHAEFVALLVDYQRNRERIGEKWSSTPAGLPAFLAHLVPSPLPKKPKPLDLWQMCTELDKIDDRPVEDPYSSRASYGMFYQWISNTTTHAGLESISRFVKEEQGVLHLRRQPDGATSANLATIMSAHVADLTADVLEAFDQSSDVITDLHIRRPRPE